MFNSIDRDGSGIISYAVYIGKVLRANIAPEDQENNGAVEQEVHGWYQPKQV